MATRYFFFFAFFTVSFTTFEVAPSTVSEPAYTALSLCTPGLSFFSRSVALPAASDTRLRTLVPSRTVTGPLGAHPSRPVPRVAEGTAARLGGATAMIDVSDGLALDLRRLADASAVGVVLDAVPIAEGADPETALTWGDDYELVFAAPDATAVFAAFDAAGLEPPIEIGGCTATKDERRLGSGPLPEGGWEHRW